MGSDLTRAVPMSGDTGRKSILGNRPTLNFRPRNDPAVKIRTSLRGDYLCLTRRAVIDGEWMSETFRLRLASRLPLWGCVLAGPSPRSRFPRLGAVSESSYYRLN
ncbi:hypothetical protein BHE74_00009677 [Ensete ventricosum]|nr:hypothetical protein GW17_00010880 [Ensete ventricosum]RWW81889.1 hypothetical protein BHE74_00009677 [Ensete ventricosum]RZS23411.1 hypothetical protein BHM03_00056347 [Ensete ventricosum]